MDEASVYKTDAVRCPYCGGLMELCSRYVHEGLYTTPDLVMQYVCTECRSSAPPVKPARGWYSCGGGGSDRYIEKAERLAWEAAVVRKAKFDNTEI